MRNRIAAGASAALALLLVQCSTFEPPADQRPLDPSLAAELSQTVRIYDPAPPNAISLGQVNATACDGPREVAISRLLAAARSRSASGVTAIACSEQGTSWYCWKSTTCTATAINIPPPPPPKPVPPKRQRRR